MEIQFLGHSCFRIKGKQAIVVTDPFLPSATGLKLPKVSADIVTVSHQHEDHNNTTGILPTARHQKPFVIDAPGEYEVGGVSVLGIPSWHDFKNGSQRGENTIYIIGLDDFRLVHLGDLGQALTEAQVEQLNGIDVLFVPVGGTYTLDPKQAADLVNQVEPALVIPMHYQLPGLTLKLAPVKDFLTQIGVKEAKKLDKLVFSKESLPEEKEVVVLDARN